MKKVTAKQRYFIADYFGNIAVAWFAAGVIGIFISGAKTFSGIVVSMAWGIALSMIFLVIGYRIIKE